MGRRRVHVREGVVTALPLFLPERGAGRVQSEVLGLRQVEHNDLVVDDLPAQAVGAESQRGHVGTVSAGPDGNVGRDALPEG